MGLLDALMGNASDVTPREARESLQGVILEGEEIKVAFKMVRDLYVFTDWRIILVDKQGITGRKTEYMTIPYKAITSFSIETAGTFDLDSELKVWISGRAAPLERTLRKGANIQGIQYAIAASLAP